VAISPTRGQEAAEVDKVTGDALDGWLKKLDLAKPRQRHRSDAVDWLKPYHDSVSSDGVLADNGHCVVPRIHV